MDGGVEADGVGPAEADCDGAVAAADVDELACDVALVADGLLPGVDVTALALGREDFADRDVTGGGGGAAGTGDAAGPWLLVLGRLAGIAVDSDVGTCGRTVGPVVPAGAVGPRCELVMAPVATMPVATIAAAIAVRTIHRVRPKPGFSEEISCSGVEVDRSSRAAS